MRPSSSTSRQPSTAVETIGLARPPWPRTARAACPRSRTRCRRRRWPPAPRARPRGGRRRPRGAPRPSGRRLRPQRGHAVAVARRSGCARAGPARTTLRRGVEQVAVALLLAQPADGADHQRVRPGSPARRARAARASAGAGANSSSGAPFQMSAHRRRRHVALAHEEVARGAADRDRAVGQAGASSAVGQALVGGHARVGEVLVQDERGPGARARPGARSRRPRSRARAGCARRARGPARTRSLSDARVEAARGRGGGPGCPASASRRDAGSGALQADERRRRSARRSKRGNHQENSRDTPWMLDPATPNLSQTWRTGTAISRPAVLRGRRGRLRATSTPPPPRATAGP